MAHERLIKRYSAYYMGWCQAFGEHEVADQGDTEIQWLLAEDRVGLILPLNLRKLFLRAVGGKKRRHPTLIFRTCTSEIVIEEKVFRLVEGRSRAGPERLTALLKSNDDVHMFLTKHFFYPPGTRILSFSRKSPLNILYKEIDPIRIRLL